MMESTPQHDEFLTSLLGKGLEESDKPPADVTTFAEAVFRGVWAMTRWRGSPTTFRTRR